MSTDETPQSTDLADNPDAVDERVMSLLSEHVPLSLIVDLSDPQGPDSKEILSAEGEPDAWWDVAGDGSAADEQEAAE